MSKAIVASYHCAIPFLAMFMVTFVNRNKSVVKKMELRQFKVSKTSDFEQFLEMSHCIPSHNAHKSAIKYGSDFLFAGQLGYQRRQDRMMQRFACHFLGSYMMSLLQTVQ